METKTRNFSIYLLKKEFGADTSLKKEHSLQEVTQAANLPENAKLYVLDNPPTQPWWRGYFGIEQDLKQASKGAILFLETNDAKFAVTFGHVSHNLVDTSYEYDFGIRVTLNSLDPNKLKSTDILEPTGAKRKRTQLPIDSDLTYFDFDKDSTILKSLTGKVLDKHKHLFKNASGSSNIRIGSGVSANEINALCSELHNIYLDNAYETSFPDIRTYRPQETPFYSTLLTTNSSPL